MKFGAPLTVLLLWMPALTHAQTACNGLSDVLSAIQTGSVAETELGLQRASHCGTALGLSGQTEWYCFWDYPFRDPNARGALENIVEVFGNCGVIMADGTSIVNHPDSFDQVAGRWNNQDVSVALKDKGALQQTLIFMRVSAAP